MRFLTKDGIVVNHLIEDLIMKKVGDQVETIQSYSHRFNVGRGTVQRAFQFLKDHEAITLEARGRAGTSVAKIDRKKLLALYSQRKFIGVMPLPYSLRYQGLATGLFLESQEKEIDLQMAFMRGAESRLSMLMDGNYDFVIMSRLSADDAVLAHDALINICNFGPGTYVHEHVVILNPHFSALQDGMRFGMDVSSRDMMILTSHMCRNIDVSYVRLPYMQLVNKVESGAIDGAVVNTDDIPDLHQRFHTIPIDVDHFQRKDTEASVVTLRQNRVISQLFQSVFDHEAIAEVQRGVVSGRVFPIY